MVIKSCGMETQVRENMRGGSGSVELLHVVSKERLPQKGRLFSIITLEKGCGIGAHEHAEETEIYYVLEGEGILDDNGTEKVLGKGDCNICGGGDYHGIRNEKDTPLKFVAAIIID